MPCAAEPLPLLTLLFPEALCGSFTDLRAIREHLSRCAAQPCSLPDATAATAAAAAGGVSTAAAAPHWAPSTNPSVADASYFASPSQQQRNGRHWGPAAAAAAKAAREALRQVAPAGDSGRRQDQPAPDLAAGGLPAAWWEAVPLPPIRLGEISSPAGLPYTLRQAQAVRAAAAGLPSSTSSFLLQVTADPSLPPIPCPPSVLAQCGELQRLAEIVQESGEGPCSASQPDQPPLLLPLAGVAPEEHGALQQLVRCQAGRTHVGLLEATQLLDVTR